MAFVPERGDIIHLEFDPASGQEMKGPHFALVLSAEAFNKARRLLHAPMAPWSPPPQCPASSPLVSRFASTLSMRLPSRSTTSKRQSSQVTMSPVRGRRSSSHMIMPERVW